MELHAGGGRGFKRPSLLLHLAVSCWPVAWPPVSSQLPAILCHWLTISRCHTGDLIFGHAVHFLHKRASDPSLVRAVSLIYLELWRKSELKLWKVESSSLGNSFGTGRVRGASAAFVARQRTITDFAPSKIKRPPRNATSGRALTLPDS